MASMWQTVLWMPARRATAGVNVVVQVMPGSIGGWEADASRTSSCARQATTWRSAWTPGRCRTNCWWPPGRSSTTPTSPKPTAARASNDALTGGLLNLAMIDYFLNCDKDDKPIAGLTAACPTTTVSPLAWRRPIPRWPTPAAAVIFRFATSPVRWALMFPAATGTRLPPTRPPWRSASKSWPYSDPNDPIPTEDLPTTP